MNVHISYKVHKTAEIEKEINHSIEKLRRRLQVFRPELVHLRGSLEQTQGKDGISVALNLRLPSGQMSVQNSATSASSALKGAFDDLVQQINKHKELLRSSHKWSNRRRVENTRREPAQVPFEQTVAAVQPLTVSPDDIRSYVNANLGRLERFVERELLFREAAEQIPSHLVSREEVIDEAIAQALGDGAEKPERLALEPWLYRLAIQAINDVAVGNAESPSSVPLAESARRPNVRASDEPELQFHQPDETLTAENIIADRRTATPEDIASSDEMISLIQFALRRTAHADREAFILNAIEGFSVQEIATITDRKSDDVISSIASAREHLRRSMPISNGFKEKLLHETKA